MRVIYIFLIYIYYTVSSRYMCTTCRFVTYACAMLVLQPTLVIYIRCILLSLLPTSYISF